MVCGIFGQARLDRLKAVLKLHHHPFAAFCQKALIAFHEREVAFTPQFVDLGDADQRAALQALWPIGKFPVLEDLTTGAVIPESSIIIEWLDMNRPGKAPMAPAGGAAIEVRLMDRLFDSYVAAPMQRVVSERLRSADTKDPTGEAEARAMLDTAYGVLSARLAGRVWASGDTFTMADCAAAPALFYADWVHPFSVGHPVLAAYFQRLLQRPSFARVIEESRPWRYLFPGGAPER